VLRYIVLHCRDIGIENKARTLYSYDKFLTLFSLPVYSRDKIRLLDGGDIRSDMRVD
jgi:hypothetical protein